MLCTLVIYNMNIGHYIDQFSIKGLVKFQTKAPICLKSVVLTYVGTFYHMTLYGLVG